jgi:hypothetical protein
MTSADDESLLRRATAWPAHRDLDELTPEVVRDVAAEHGLDFATALLYDRVVNSARHGPTIAAIDACDGAAVARRTADPCSPIPAECRYLIGVVPGAFYVESPDSGADGNRFLPELNRLGRRCELIRTASFGSPKSNGKQLLTWLAERRGERVVLVSLSKGGADVKHALALAAAQNNVAGTPFANVTAWINVSGILDGSPLVRWLVDRPWRALPVRAMFLWRRYRFSVLRELEHGRGTPLDFPLTLPAQLRAVHVVGFPTTTGLSSKLAARGHRRMTPSGPNDAVGIVLAEACRWPGVVYPVWDADHYLRAPGREMGLIIRRLLDWIDRGFASPTENPSSDSSLINTTTTDDRRYNHESADVVAREDV